MNELLNLLKQNAFESPENLAKILGISADEVKTRIAEYEKSGVIRAYQAVVNEEKLATMSGVTSTVTHFMMKTYKQNGILMHTGEGDERLKVSP